MLSLPSFHTLLCIALVLHVSAAAHVEVTISNGTVVGHSESGIDGFFGIPYALPPTGSLRLRPPQSINESFGRLKLPKSNSDVQSCTQMTLTSVNLTATTKIPRDQQEPYYQPNSGFGVTGGEDCLTINVQRPANMPPASRLPVLFWIYGGGFEVGATSDGSVILNQNISMGEPIVFVAVNYRLNAFGFLQGEELARVGATNVGLRDQRMGLEWVAENIAAFGGDPDQVTIWGESAGAASVFNQLTVKNGDHKYRGRQLFRAAIMNSGTVLGAQSATSTSAQNVFDQVTAYAGCPKSLYKGDSVLECLRDIPHSNFKGAMDLLPNFAGSRSNALAYLPRPDASSTFFAQYGDEAVRSGRYAKVPVIMGNLEDEATVFVAAQQNIIHDKKSLVDYFATWLSETPRSLVENLIDTYSTDPADGMPIGTGTKYQIYPLSKMNAAIQSDLTFIMARRVVLSYMYSHVPTWSYLGTYLHGSPWWGTFHTADLPTQFGQEVNAFAGKKMNEAYIHFVNYMDPNGNKSDGEAWWPKWDPEELKMANFSKNAVGVTEDDFRWSTYEFWRGNVSHLRI